MVLRKRIQELTAREFCLYRAICLELDELAEEIEGQGDQLHDVLTLATAMRDRRLLVQWLRELQLPPSAMYGRHGLSETMEDRLLRDISADL